MPGFIEDSTTASSPVKAVARTIAELFILMSRFLALVVLAIYLPALLAASLLVLATSSGPAFVSKAYKRRDGNVVYLYEFRTECWKTYRETAVCAFLRNADLVRLPRLANVLLGQISAGERVERLNG
jgi:lipopolysaccharide/colanic/teichoic acid biosynthesis glycosyltransferase